MLLEWLILKDSNLKLFLQENVSMDCILSNKDNLEYKIPRTKHQIPNTKYQAPNAKHQMPSTKYQAPNTKHQIPKYYSYLVRRGGLLFVICLPAELVCLRQAGNLRL